MQLAVTHISWLAVIAAFLAYYLLGALWFAGLFPKQYNRSLELPSDTRARRDPIFFAGPALATFVVVLVTSILMKALSIDSYENGLLLGAVVGIGYLVTTTVNTAINPLFKHPLRYGLISGSYHLLGILIATAILVALQ